MHNPRGALRPILMPNVLLRRDRRRPIVLISLVGLLVSVTVAMLVGIVSFDSSARWVSHTHQVLGQIESLRSALDSTESAARGYRLSGDARLEAEYIQHRAGPPEQADVLVAMVSDNPAQQRRAEQLRSLVRERLGEIERTVELQKAGRGVDANRTMIGAGRRTRDLIDISAGGLERIERRLLADRSSESDRGAWILGGIVALGLAVALAMLGWLLRMLGQEAKRARMLEHQSREALAFIESSSAQRELLAEQRRVLGAFAGLLHSCQGVEEALDVAGNALSQLIPNGAAVCYTMRASQNLLEMHALFGTHGAGYGDAMRPDQCWGLRRGTTHVYDPVRPTALCEHLRELPPDDARGVCVPLASQGTVLGLMHVGTRRGDELTDLERAAVESVGEHLALVLYSLGLRESLRVQSLRDPLTGLYNRRYLEESLPREMERCERRGRPLSVLMLDVDHFKRFNDEHGHGAGDALLTRIGQVLAAVTRGEDIACRYGGEEFTIVMPEANLEHAAARAEQIRQSIADSTVSYMRRELGPVTASIGVNQFRPGMDSPETLMASADRALYAAKAQGRNRVICNAPVTNEISMLPHSHDA
ncbi:sensor domain-containing diguanylate cyclase [Cognatilysobacter lacus]|uniref:diguanylate cyclase n=1 Tax=Cognatilysobacter lacus TaxID=1643323 RepID=A0A5D8Z0V8_9GAMM|nr:diguanylate cyclase [Lysobacter lacus]TZF87712.1 diguanylate cyclase [Lysobacter lacus]